MCEWANVCCEDLCFVPSGIFAIFLRIFSDLGRLCDFCGEFGRPKQPKRSPRAPQTFSGPSSAARSDKEKAPRSSQRGQNIFQETSRNTRNEPERAPKRFQDHLRIKNLDFSETLINCMYYIISNDSIRCYLHASFLSFDG